MFSSSSFSLHGSNNFQKCFKSSQTYYKNACLLALQGQTKYLKVKDGANYMYLYCKECLLFFFFLILCLIIVSFCGQASNLLFVVDIVKWGTSHSVINHVHMIKSQVFCFSSIVVSPIIISL